MSFGGQFSRELRSLLLTSKTSRRYVLNKKRRKPTLSRVITWTRGLSVLNSSFILMVETPRYRATFAAIKIADNFARACTEHRLSTKDSGYFCFCLKIYKRYNALKNKGIVTVKLGVFFA